jgi:arginyl-tRNA synthetase
VKYAHARICSVLRNAKAQGADKHPATEKELKLLCEDAELALCRLLPDLPHIIARSAATRDVSRLTRYAVDLASAFHHFYQHCRILTDDTNLSRARLALSNATRVVLANTLTLLGMDTPEQM